MNQNINPPSSTLRVLQIDPGDKHWSKSIFDLTTQAGAVVRVADVLATNRAGEGFDALREHWYGFEGRSLAGASTLRVAHVSQHDWDAYPASWKDGSPTDRLSGYAEMDVNVSYTSVTTGPAQCFYATLSSGLGVRLHLELDTDGNIDAVTWYHNGSSDPDYILVRNGVIDFSFGTVSWTNGSWKAFSY